MSHQKSNKNYFDLQNHETVHHLLPGSGEQRNLKQSIHRGDDALRDGKAVSILRSLEILDEVGTPMLQALHNMVSEKGNPPSTRVSMIELGFAAAVDAQQAVLRLSPCCDSTSRECGDEGALSSLFF